MARKSTSMSTAAVPALALRGQALIEQARSRATERAGRLAGQIVAESAELYGQLTALVLQATHLDDIKTRARLLPAPGLLPLQRSHGNATAVAGVLGWALGEEHGGMSMVLGEAGAPYDVIPVPERLDVRLIARMTTEVQGHRDALIEKILERRAELDAAGASAMECEADPVTAEIQRACQAASVCATTLSWLIGQEREAFEALLEGPE